MNTLKPKNISNKELYDNYKNNLTHLGCINLKDIKPSKVRHISVEDYLSNELQGHKDF